MKLSRRNILGVAGAITGGAGLALVPTSTGAAVPDPVLAHVGRRRELMAEIERLSELDDAAVLAKDHAAIERIAVLQSDAGERLLEVEQLMLGLVATTPAGIAEQVDILRDFLAITEYESGADNVITALRRLGSGGRGAA